MKLNPNNPDWYCAKGYALLTLGRYEHALLEYDEAIKLRPNNPGYHAARGEALTYLERYDEALSEYDEAIQFNTNNPDYHAGRGKVLYHLEMGKKANKDWNKIYSNCSLDQIPWHADKPEQELIELIESEKIRPLRVLDVGCGTGTDAIYLASIGSNVTAIDLSQEATNTARERANKAGVKVNFITGDFLDVEFDNESFDFVNDRGCFHHINPLQREDFITKVNNVLMGRSLYYLRCWSDKEEKAEGPYKISKDVIHRIFSKYLDVGEIKDFRFGGKGSRGYVCLMRRKA
jgi:2-polyprenyl-3-methyl-5-hydroxy-6-metoxy-1,4-benzoquinol methylase